MLRLCVDDGQEPINITSTGFAADERRWFLTSLSGFIIDELSGEPPFDISGYEGRQVAIFSVGYSGELFSAEAGDNICMAGSTTGCFGISNSIAIIRNTGDDCRERCIVDGGSIELAGGETTTSICLDNGTPTDVPVTRGRDATGGNMTFLITDAENRILEIPNGNGPFDFGSAPAGNCIIWYLAYDTGLEGLQLGNTPEDFDGCFDLSNPITVIRQSGDDCPPLPCEVSGGRLVLEDGSNELTMCVDDGIADPFTTILVANQGENFSYVITDETGVILSLPPTPPFQLEGAPAGVCQLYHISYGNNLTGLERGGNLSDLGGCFDLSTAITITRQTGDDCPPPPCEVAGGMLVLTQGGDSLTICAGDGQSDEFNVIVADTVASEFIFLITDTDGIILDVQAEQPFDFEGAGIGTCLLYGLSSSGEVAGVAAGARLSGISGCAELSNPITIIRQDPEVCAPATCEAEGGLISLLEDGSTNVTICADDDEPNPLTILIQGAEGDSTGFIITDMNLRILNVAGQGPIDLEGSGGGNCLIWHVAYDDTFTGNVIGNPIMSLDGCFDFSNAITVTRLVGEDCPSTDTCQVTGGELALTGGGTEITICANDGIPDPFDVVLEDSDAPNQAYLITDEGGTILGLPAAPPFDLEEAGSGTCLVWSISFDDGLQGLEEQANVDDLVGCFELSNAITVTRLEGQDCADFNCNTSGGRLSFSPDQDLTITGNQEVSICVDDGQSDMIQVDLRNAVGANRTFLLTDSNLVILRIETNPVFDLEGTGPGTCLIWSMSSEGGLLGVEVGQNANRIRGCYSFSNSLTVRRLAGDRCEVINCTAQGGNLTLADGSNDLEICVGDGVPDPFEMVLTDTMGLNFAYVLTRTDGRILGSFTDQPVDLDFLNPGNALIWALSYGNTLDGLNAGANIADLTGCFGLSDSIFVTRLSGDDCTAGRPRQPGVVFSEVGQDGFVEILVTDERGVNMSQLYLATGVLDEVVPLTDLFVVCGDLSGKSGTLVGLDATGLFDSQAGELALFRSDNPYNTAELVSYLRWGDGSDYWREAAIATGHWLADAPVLMWDNLNSLQRTYTNEAEYAARPVTYCTVDATVGTEAPAAAGSVRVLPNPFAGSFVVEIADAGSGSTELVLHDMAGRVLRTEVLNFRTGRVTMDTGDLPAGTYFLRLTNGVGVSVLRVVRR